MERKTNRGTAFEFLKSRRWIFILVLLSIVDFFCHRRLPDVAFLSFACLLTSITITVLVISTPAIRRFCSVPFAPRLVPITRVMYAALCLITAVQHFTLIESGMEPRNFAQFGLEAPGIVAYAVSVGYIAGLTAILFGKCLRPAWIVVFLTGTLVIPFSLEIFLKNIINFYAIFVPVEFWTGRKSKREYSATAFLMMAASLTFLTTCAGFYKALDPVWLKGLGLYYSLNINAFPPTHLRPLLHVYPLMIALNWVTIVVEIIAFPLFCFRKTRIAGVIALASLGFFLTYPMMGIGLVGGPILLSLIPAFLGFFPRAPFFPEPEEAPLPSAAATKGSSRQFAMVLLLFWWTFSGFVYRFSVNIDQILSWPPAYGGFVVSKEHRIRVPFYLDRRRHWATNAIGIVRPATTFESVWVLGLFDYHHLFDRVNYRIRFYDSFGNSVVPIKFFEDDGAQIWQTHMWGNERFLLPCWTIMTTIQFHSPDRPLDDGPQQELNALIRYSRGHLRANFEPESAVIEARCIYQPNDYQGNWQSPEPPNWVDFYVYRYETNKGYLVEYPERFNYSRLKIPAFENGVLTPRERY